jgi:hypothetical protein
MDKETKDALNRLKETKKELLSHYELIPDMEYKCLWFKEFISYWFVRSYFTVIVLCKYWYFAPSLKSWKDVEPSRYRLKKEQKINDAV